MGYLIKSFNGKMNMYEEILVNVYFIFIASVFIALNFIKKYTDTDLYRYLSESCGYDSVFQMQVRSF